MHLAWQVATLDIGDPANCLARFKANHRTGMILFAGLALAFALLLSILAFCAETDLGAQEKSLLWKVSRDTNSIYLLGSIHYLRKENYPLKKPILDAFEASKRLVLEIDLNATSPEGVQKVRPGGKVKTVEDVNSGKQQESGKGEKQESRKQTDKAPQLEAKEQGTE